MAGRVFEAISILDIELKATWLVVPIAYDSYKDWPLILEGDSQQVVHRIKERDSANNDHLMLVDL